MWIIGVSNVGPITAGEWRGHRRSCIDCSLAIDPEGTPIAQAAYGAHAVELMIINVPIHSSR
ncbi:MAG: hypothetical protein R3F19_19480 [Verrucomicrobiales bacterium]